MSTSDCLFAPFQPQPPDGLLKLIGEYRSDPRPQKIDLGVGVFRDETGATPIPGAVKAAERLLLERQSSKSYLGPEGNLAYAAALKALVLGTSGDDRTVCIQTPGGTGALRLGLDLVAAAGTGAKLWVGTPSWPNHFGLAAASGVEVVRYPFFDQASQSILFDQAIETLKTAKAGDVVLLHGCCHNPSGADLSADQWAVLASLLSERGLIPLIDLAYQGLGDGFDADGAGVRLVMASCNEVLLAYSCDKNFALYRERVGALFVRADTAKTAETVFSNLLALARTNWSMPPDHGAAIVQTVLENEALRQQWSGELDIMRLRIAGLRSALATAEPALASLGRQHGMFSLLPLKPEQVARLKAEFAIYLAASGRINVAGFTRQNIPHFLTAFRSVA